MEIKVGAASRGSTSGLFVGSLKVAALLVTVVYTTGCMNDSSLDDLELMEEGV